MQAIRIRTSSAAEWLTAAIFLAATLAVGLLVVRELRTLPPPAPIQAPMPASAVPADAVSVPALMQGTPDEIRVGELAAEVVARLGGSLVHEVREQGPIGPRDIRSYDLGGTRFLLVLEPFERGGEPRVAAIYVR
jgi:hypothetical protein